MQEQQMNNLYGFVEVWLQHRSFGFIFGDDGVKYYFNNSNIARGIPQTGAGVSFFVGQSRRGPVAMFVEVELPVATAARKLAEAAAKAGAQ